MKMPGNMQAMMQQAQKMQQKMQGVKSPPFGWEGLGRRHGQRKDGRPQERPLAVKIDAEVAGDVEMLQ